MEKVTKITSKAKLRLVRSKMPSRFAVGSVDIVAAPENKPPFRIDAVAYEEDTFLVLSAPLKLSDPQKTLVRLLLLRQILNQEPSWKKAWIVSALEKIFSEAKGRKLRAIALPLLGTRHGSLEKESFLVLLRSAVERIATPCLKRTWLMLPPGIDPRMLEILKSNHRKKKELDTKNT